MRVFGNLRGWVGRVVYHNFLSRNEDTHSCLETLHIETGILSLEFHKIQGREVACGVVQEHVFRAGVGRMNGFRPLAGMPFLDRSIILQTRIPADVRAFCDAMQQIRSALLLKVFLSCHCLGPPFAIMDGSIHEFVTDTDR